MRRQKIKNRSFPVIPIIISTVKDNHSGAENGGRNMSQTLTKIVGINNQLIHLPKVSEQIAVSITERIEC